MKTCLGCRRAHPSFLQVYQEDGNVAELQDTVARAARIEVNHLVSQEKNKVFDSATPVWIV